MTPQLQECTPILEFDVVISGASFAGMAFARALSQATTGALRIGLVDRAAKPPASAADVRAFALGAASKRLLDGLGAWQAISPYAQPVSKIDITDSALEAGVRPVLLSYDNLLTDQEPATFIVPSPSLTNALEALVATDGAIHRLTPVEITSFGADTSRIAMSLSNGTAITAKLLVAADGKSSPLREKAGIKCVGWDYGQDGIVTIVAHERPHGGKAVQHFLPSGPFAILPLPGSRSCITWSEKREEARRVMGLDDGAFLSEVDRRFGGRLGRLTLDGPRQSWPLTMHLARQLAAPRFAVIGDAAHGVHPIAGQGLNLGFRDVAALTEVVTDAARLGLDFGSSETLGRYQRWRRFDNWLSASVFDGLNRTFASDVTLLRSARELGLGIVDRLPGLKRFFVTEAAGLSGEVPRLLKGEPI